MTPEDHRDGAPARTHSSRRVGYRSRRKSLRVPYLAALPGSIIEVRCCCPRHLALLRYRGEQTQLGPLLLPCQDVALDRRRESALRGEAELVDRRVLRRSLDAALELVLRLELAALRRHEAEHDLLLALRQEAERL